MPVARTISGPVIAARSAATSFALGGSFRNMTTRCAGSRSASVGKGLRDTTAFHSVAVRTKQSVSRPQALLQQAPHVDEPEPSQQVAQLAHRHRLVAADIDATQESDVLEERGHLRQSTAEPPGAP